MVICDNGHGKIDKETQSPLLNIFKEIMTREKDDPEKRNLLTEPREENKKRQYSGSRNKSERRSCESSGSEHRKRGSYKISTMEQRTEFNNKVRSQSMPYQTEKKDSWWFWQNTPPKKTEDSCSCVSCALKKIVSSEYACIGCLLILFTISIIVAFLVVFKNVPNIGGDCKVLECKDCKESTTGAGPATPRSKECKGVVDSERLKRKIEMLSNKRLKKGFIGVNEFRKGDDKGYDEVLSGQIGIPRIDGIEFGPSFRELNSMEESDHRQPNDMDLSSILNGNNMDIQNSEKLRGFYKKLVQTDAKIKSLKRIDQADSYIEDVVQKSPDRSRRSLKLYHYPKRYRLLRRRRSIYGKQHKVNETSVAKTKSGNKTRLKRFNNEAEEPTGFIIEKKKLLVQYKPADKRRIPVKKCQHAPAGTHTHEKQMMHPFYKNTQRLDLLLDKFLNKNLPEIMTDPFGIDELFNHEKLNKPCKHPKPHKNVNIIDDGQFLDQVPKLKYKPKKIKEDKIIGSSTTPDLYKMLRLESTTQYERSFFNHAAKMIGKQKKKMVTATPNDFEVLLSVSTIMNPELLKMSTRPPFGYEGTKLPTLNRVPPNLRRLMQLEAGEDEENLGYEDFKEVLTDDMDNHDEAEKSIDRKRRDIDLPEPLKYPKFNPPQTVHNPNWKGAMPLYPDEINAMLANNKVDVPKPTQELQDLLAAQRKGRDLSDIEYVEDYLANKYNRLVQQAQAYSDYGVLDGKKESRNEKESPTADSATNHKIKLSADENFNRVGLLARLKRGRVPRVVTREPADIRKPAALLDEIEVTSPGYPAQTGIYSNSFKVTQTKPKLPMSEGLRIEIRPGTKPSGDVSIIYKTFKKIVSEHFKLRPYTANYRTSTRFFPNYIHSNVISNHPDVGLISNTKSAESTTTKTTVLKTLDELENEKQLGFPMTSGIRRLLSTDFESPDFPDYKNTLGNRRVNTERNRSNIDRFVSKLNMNKNIHSADEIALKNYIEGVKQMNIKIFSTPGPSYGASRLTSEAQHTIREESVSPTDPIEVGKYPVEILKVDTQLPDSEVTINKSLVKVDTGDSFFGKILLTVKDPEFGAQNFNLIFDVPLVMNFKKELMMLDDNDPNLINQFEIYSDSTIDPQGSDMDFYPNLGSEKFVQTEIIAKRLKRETNLTSTLTDRTETTEHAKQHSNVTENLSESGKEVSFVPAVTFNSTNSIDSSAPAVTLKLEQNKSATSTPNPNAGRYANSTMTTGDNMTLSEFFGAVANWFRTLEYGKQDNPQRDSSGSILSDMLLMLNSNITKEPNVSSTDSAYPLYDSDMIENIGHRSRVLLSVEDTVTNVTEENQLVNSSNATKVTAASTASEGNVFNRSISTTPTIDLRSNVTTSKYNPDIKTFPIIKKDSKTKVKAIVKRNADDSNLIFWNDIYDDEYGIQRDKMDSFMKDKMDDAVRDKHTVKEKDFIKKSGRWVQNKIRKFAKNLKISPHLNNVTRGHSVGMETKERVQRSIRHNNHGLVAPLPTYYEIEDRDEIKEEDYPDVDQKSLFAALSVNMKEVCKKAAKAVEQTRNMGNVPNDLGTNGGTKEDSKQGSIANALMQQLVRLLTDLVDYQVQQKTCTKLPVELQTFLEWLTNNKGEPEELDKPSELLFMLPNHEDEELIDDFRDRQDDVIQLGVAQDLTAEDKIHYQDSIHSIQDLLAQYDDMTDDEKSKLLGVRDYLEKQQAYLNQQLSAYELYRFFEKRDITRNKRNVYIIKQRSTKHKPRGRPHKFIRNFGKKHTRTTAGYHDEAQITDMVMNRKTVANKHTIHPASDKNVHQKMTKRNLKDVYYKAISEARKLSSVKNIHSKDESSRFETSTAVGHT